MIALKLHLNQYSVLCHSVPPAANIVLAATECSLEHTSGWDFWSNCIRRSAAADTMLAASA